MDRNKFVYTCLYNLDILKDYFKNNRKLHNINKVEYSLLYKGDKWISTEEDTNRHTKNMTVLENPNKLLKEMFDIYEYSDNTRRNIDNIIITHTHYNDILNYIKLYKLKT